MAWWICSQFGCRVLTCQTQTDNDRAICCFYKVKHARYECDTRVDRHHTLFCLIPQDAEWRGVLCVDVTINAEDKTMSQMVNPRLDDACRPTVYSSSLPLINQSQHKYICIHIHTHAHAHRHTHTVHLPVLIISGFPQWVIEPVLFFPLSLTFPSEPPTTVGLITCSSNTYLLVQWQLMWAGFIWFSTNNSRASVILPLFHQPKQ